MRMGGMCYGASLIFIPVNALQLFNPEQKKELIAVLAHELFHATRWQHIGGASTLKEILVNEGAACHFEEDIVGEVRKRYYQSISKEAIQYFRDKAKLSYGTYKDVYEQWFLEKDKNIPLWTGYALGYELVEHYLVSHPNTKRSSLYALRAWEF